MKKESIKKYISLKNFPDDWNVYDVGELLKKFQNGYAFSSAGYSNETQNVIPIITMANITLEGSFSFDYLKAKKWDKKFIDKLKSYFVSDGDLIIAMTDVTPSMELIGRGTLVSTQEPLLLNQRVGLLKTIDDVDNRFLSYFFNSNYWRNYSKVSASLGAQANISTKDILKGRIPLPPLPEQKKITEIISGIDELIENLESKIQKLLILQEGMKNDLLSRGYGHKDFRESEIGMIPKSWEVKCLRVICEKISDRDHTTPIYVNPNEGIPIISPTNLNSDMELDLSKIKYISKEAHLKNQKKTDLMPDDIIFSRIGAALGKSYLIKKSFYDFSILHSICQIRVKQNLVHPNYLLWQMRKSFFQNSLWLGVQSIGVPDLGLNEIGKLKIPICSLKEQKVITNYLDKMHLQILQIRKKLTQTKSLKKSIMKELLTGKVRVQVN